MCRSPSALVRNLADPSVVASARLNKLPALTDPPVGRVSRLSDGEQARRRVAARLFAVGPKEKHERRIRHPVLISIIFCRFQKFESLLGLPANGQIGCRTAWTNTLRFGTIETMATPIEQIRQLPVAEQLAIVEQIWDGLHDSRDLVQDWQVSEARRRSAELDADPSIAISEKNVWERVDKLLE